MMNIDSTEVVAVCTAVTAVFTYLTNRKVDKVETKVIANGVRMDGRLDELISLTKTTSHAEGVKEEKDRDKSGDNV